MRVYLDNCCYNRPYDEQVQLRIRLETEAKPRDYTRWRETHYTGEGETIQELGEKIMAYAATMAERTHSGQAVPAMA